MAIRRCCALPASSSFGEADAVQQGVQQQLRAGPLLRQQPAGDVRVDAGRVRELQHRQLRVALDWIDSVRSSLSRSESFLRLAR